MYSNLIGLIAVRKISKVDIAKAMGIDRSTLENKLRGKSEFSVSEMYFIQQKFFPDVQAEKLFEKDFDCIPAPA